MSFNQDDWAKWLSLAEFSYNNSPSTSTGFSPFFALQGYHPRFNSLAASSTIPLADDFVSHLQEIQQNLADNLRMAKEAQAKFYNGSRRIDVTYEPGDFVWLSRKHLKTKRPSNKLDVRRIGPFKVIRMIGKNAAELLLPDNVSRIHPVFNISLLMPFVDTTSRPLEIPPKNPQDFFDEFVEWGDITYILDYRRTHDGIHEYLVRGLDASGLDDGWQELTTFPISLDSYLRRFHVLSPHLGPGPLDTVWHDRQNRT